MAVPQLLANLTARSDLSIWQAARPSGFLVAVERIAEGPSGRRAETSSNREGETMGLQLTRIGQPDLQPITSWVRSYAEMVQWSGPWNFTFPLDEDQLARFFLTETLDGGLRRMQFVARDSASEAPVGQIGFSRIWPRTDAAHLGPVIVDPARRGSGIGSRMVREVLKIGFEQLRLHRIELVVFDFNATAIACYERAGFRTEGVLRDIVRVGDVYWHWRAMSVLEDEWRATTGEGVA